jgi:hypothetical protein
MSLAHFRFVGIERPKIKLDRAELAGEACKQASGGFERENRIGGGNPEIWMAWIEILHCTYLVPGRY